MAHATSPTTNNDWTMEEHIHIKSEPVHSADMESVNMTAFALDHQHQQQQHTHQQQLQLHHQQQQQYLHHHYQQQQQQQQHHHQLMLQQRSTPPAAPFALPEHYQHYLSQQFVGDQKPHHLIRHHSPELPSAAGAAAAAASTVAATALPTGFNPLTPPGYGGTSVMAAVRQNLHQHQLQQQQQQLQQLQHSQHQHSTPSMQSVRQQQHTSPTVSPIALILTPNVTPPMHSSDDSPVSLASSPQRSVAAEAAAVSPSLAVPSASDATISATVAATATAATKSHDTQAFEDSIYKARYNAKGQPKRHKCKQCHFSTLIKADLWQHSVSHMNADKILWCAQCPFVTEYRHHLDFHCRNHNGEKPFKCEQCEYSCVNKSMLKSHMKSHSDVREYACIDCPYTSKYCHSMKIHLRTKGHHTTEETFIDVNGSRRGPKRAAGDVDGADGKPRRRRDSKRAKLMKQEQVEQLQSQQQLSVEGQGEVAMAQQLAEQQKQWLLQYVRTQQQQQQPQQLQAQQLPLQVNDLEQQREELAKRNMQNIMFLLAQMKAQSAATAALSSHHSHASSSNSDDEHGEDDEEDEDEDEDYEMHHGDNGIDLSAAASSHRSDLPMPSATSRATTSSDTPKLSSITAHRRKGLAFKLNAINEEAAPEIVMDTDRLAANCTPNLEPMKEPMASDSPTSTTSSPPAVGAVAPATTVTVAASTTYKAECQPCGIQFADLVIHRLHMAYHGFAEPFTCNVCGTVCTDRVMFNMHIATQAH